MSEWNAKNPASWLARIWDQMPRDTNSMQKPALRGWAATFGYEVSDFRVLEGLTSLYANVEEATRLVGKLNTTARKKEQLCSWRPAFEGALGAVTSGHQWQHVVQHFTADRRVHLDYCATELDLAIDSTSTISDIQTQIHHIESLLTKLHSDDSVDQGFKALVHDLLEALRRALSEYSVRGQKGVMDCLGFIFGNLLRYRDSFDTPQKKKWASELREVISLAADVATVTGMTAVAIGPAVAGFLS